MTRQSVGVCYYPEHWPEERWPVDAAMMREAGIAYVRIGEFAWSRLEPDPGRYDFDWLARAIDTLHAEGLKVVLGTPTATPPKWLVDKMPDMLGVDREGRPRGFGSRRHYCFSHLGYRAECARIVTELCRRFGEHPAVAAWQTDNEYGCHDTVESYSQAVLSGFRDWLAQKYQSPQALNRAWGNVFWSMEYRSFEEIELPNLTVTEANPAHRLDFQRYSSDQVVAFNRIQTEIIRRHSPGRPILHNFMGSFLAFDHFAVSRDLDVASWDSYPIGFLDRDSTDAEHKARYMRVGDPDLQAFHHDLYRACGRGRWWVMEQQPGPVNWAPHNPSPAPGAVRLWAWEAFAAGAEVVSYFRWRQAPMAQEQMHEALLLPDGSRNEAWHAAKTVAAEIEAIGATVETAGAEAAIVFDYESAWAWAIQPHGRSFDYLGLVMIFYRALRRLGVSIDVISPEAAAMAGRKLIVIPGLFSASGAFAEGLRDSGATVLFGPRTGSRTVDFRIPDALPPGDALQELIPVKVRRVDTFPPPHEIVVGDPARGHCFQTWREFLMIGDAAVIDRTTDGEAALCASLDGRVHYLAGQPNPAYAQAIVADLCARAGIATQRLARDIRIRDNGELRFVFNYGPELVDIRQLAGDAALLLGESILPPCGVAAFRTETS